MTNFEILTRSESDLAGYLTIIINCKECPLRNRCNAAIIVC